MDANPTLDETRGERERERERRGTLMGLVLLHDFACGKVGMT